MMKSRLKVISPAVVALSMVVATTAPATAADVPAKQRPQELGAIDWGRDFDAALARGKRENKPVLVLFQEVPGCSTCTTYGDVVLSHPLIRDAAESLFVPIAVYNNIKGDDERVLKSFAEPAWNNPVVRIMRHDRSMLADRVSGDYSKSGLVGAMSAALKKEKRNVPEYLQLLHDELTARQTGLENATFVMHCFWEGERRLGALDGVVETTPGFVKGKEVVDVYFDPKRISFVKLTEEARRLKCADAIFARTDKQHSEAAQIDGLTVERTDERTKPDKVPKYYMSKTPYRFVPMTEAQSARVNAALANKKNADRFLSPSQLRILAAVKAKPDAGWAVAIGAKELKQAFATAETLADRVAPTVARR